MDFPTLITEFNKTLEEFIDKMILQFPEETKLKSPSGESER